MSTTPNPVHLSIGAIPNPCIGTVAFGGWALSLATTIATVAYEIDGGASSAALYGGPRPDVAAAYPTALGAPYFSWNVLAFDTTKLANGTHSLSVTVTDGDGNTLSASVEFLISNPVPAPAAQVYVTEIAVSSGQLAVAYSNGTAQDLTLPVGPASRGISAAAIQNGQLVITLSDGTVSNLGTVVGTDGTDGINGTNGVSVTGAVIQTNGHLVLTLSDGSTVDAGSAQGADTSPMPYTEAEVYDNATAAALGVTGIGSVDGQNETYTLPFTPAPNTLVKAYLNGLRQFGGFTVSGAVVAFAPAIPAGMSLAIDYWHA